MEENKIDSGINVEEVVATFNDEQREAMDILLEAVSVASQNESKGNDLTYISEVPSLEENDFKSMTKNERYIEGQNEALYYAGFYTTLTNFGMSLEMAESLVNNMKILDVQDKLSEEEILEKESKKV